MKKTWILVADSSKARLFTVETASGPLVEVRDFMHPEARMHEKELTTDLPGKHRNDTGVGAHGFEQEVEPKEQEAIRFAHELAAFLDKARNEHGYEQLVVVAAPKFLGHLREALPAPVRNLVRLEIDKNLVGQSPEDIRKHLPEYLPNG
ncbi:MAG: host attachment protein [Gammaproteobacteria bacterium]|nr:MAG: host attachment protein [Gammaproteobacteria bacterium]